MQELYYTYKCRQDVKNIFKDSLALHVHITEIIIPLKTDIFIPEILLQSIKPIFLRPIFI